MTSSTQSSTMSQRTTDDVSKTASQSVSEVQVKPHEEHYISLGFFTKRREPRGFSVEFTPEPGSDHSVVTEMKSLGSTNRYELILYLANHGSLPVTAQVCQL